MHIPENSTEILQMGMLGILGWIGRSLAKMVKEIKMVSLIVRSCPGCKETVDRLHDAEEHV